MPDPADRGQRYDAIVVGAGHNGLVAAAYLARAGRSVCVLERRDVIGGATITEELAPGFRVSTASYSLSLLRPDVHADLALASHGLEIHPKDPQLFVPLPDGRSFFVWRDAARTRAELDAIRPGDGDGYVRWSRFWDGAVAELRPWFESADPPPLHEIRGLLSDDVRRFAVDASAAETAAAFFEAPEIQGAFASQGIIGTWAGVRHPGTAWVLAYHAIGGELCGADGTWAHVRGGMGALASAIASSARAAGAEVRTSAPVRHVTVEAGRAVGVELEDGEHLRAHAVLSNADPKTTFLQLAPHEAMDPAFVERVIAWQTPGCVLKVNLALAELPEFRSRPGRGPQACHRGTVEIAPSVDYLQEAYEDAAHGSPSRAPFIELFLQSAVDPSLVGGDGHVLSAFTQYVPPNAGADWEAVKETATAAVLDTICEHAPNVRDAIVAADVLGPPELEERFGLTGGNIFHGEIVPRQSFGDRFDYRTPIDGLYLCGSGARPGGAVTGAAGRNAAKVVLADGFATGGARGATPSV